MWDAVGRPCRRARSCGGHRWRRLWDFLRGTPVELRTKNGAARNSSTERWWVFHCDVWLPEGSARKTINKSRLSQRMAAKRNMGGIYIYIIAGTRVVSIVVHGDYCQWTGFVGKIYCRKPLIFRFLIWGFPVKLSQKPIHWYCRWLQMIRCKLSLFSLAHRPGMLESGRTRASS